MECLKTIAPKNFMGKYPLQTGARNVGIFMALVAIISAIGFLSQMFFYKKCTGCTKAVLHDIFAFCINTIIYCVIMFFVHLWFIWGVLHSKSSVVLSWVVITTMWWLQGSSFIFIIITINITEISMAWIAALIFAFIGFVISGYCLLVGFGFWLEIKKRSLVVEIPAPPLPLPVIPEAVNA